MNFRADSHFRSGDFARLEELIVPRLVAASEKAAQLVYDESQVYVAVDTGELKSSGKWYVEQLSMKVVGYVSYTAEHASYNEFGTGMRGASSGNAAPGISYNPSWPGMPGTPFLRPAMDVKHDDIRAAFVEQGFRA